MYEKYVNYIMIVAQETTQWSSSAPNHIYFLNDARTKMYAFIHESTGESKIFKNPIDIYVRGRTFEVLRKVDIEKVPNSTPVTGSKGDVYHVTNHDNDWKCTCTGYKYHGTCKHIERVKLLPCE